MQLPYRPNGRLPKRNRAAHKGGWGRGVGLGWVIDSERPIQYEEEHVRMNDLTKGVIFPKGKEAEGGGYVRT